MRRSCHKRSIERILHASAGVADLLGRSPRKSQSRNQFGGVEYARRFEEVAEDLGGSYWICGGFKDRAEFRVADRRTEGGGVRSPPDLHRQAVGCKMGPPGSGCCHVPSA